MGPTHSAPTFLDSRGISHRKVSENPTDHEISLSHVSTAERRRRPMPLMLAVGWAPGRPGGAASVTVGGCHGGRGAHRSSGAGSGEAGIISNG